MKHSHFLQTLSAFIFFLTFANASTYRATIDHVDYGKKSEPDLLMFADGRVGFVEKNKTSLLDVKSFQAGDVVKVRLNKKFRVVELIPITTVEKDFLDEPESFDEADGKRFYTPTILSSMSQASTMFFNMRGDYQRESQCYNRAHVWAYEEWKRNGTNLMKVFVFYTRRYIREYNFNWWFHAIPAVYVGNELITLDRRYARGPLSMKPWTDIFVRSKRTCALITKYSTYRKNQESEHCYLHYASMYFWQPYELDRNERTGYTKTQFFQNQVNHAYWEAF
jgi:hypothetical protein